MGEPMPHKAGRKPNITLSETDYDHLTHLAKALEAHDPEQSEIMMSELDRARVIRDGKLPAGIVRMGSTLSYTADDGDRKTVTLVYPGDADISEGRISITTPVGTALIGLKEGQSINWHARNGQTHKLTVLEVYEPTTAEPT